MANEILTPSIIAKEALMVLRNNTVMASLVHRDYSGEFNKVGDTITIRKPAEFEAKEFIEEIEVQDAKEQSLSVKMDKHLDVSFAVTAKEKTLDIADFSRQFITPAMQSFAQKIDTYLVDLYSGINNFVARSATADIKDIANCGKVLNQNAVPNNNRRMVLSPGAYADYVVLPPILNAEKSGSTEALRNASMGKILGFDTFMDQNIKTHTSGTLGSCKVKTQAEIGATTITLTNTTLTGNLVKGDIITINGDTAQYLITQAAEASENDITVSIYPGLKMQAKANAAVTLAGAGEQNLAFHKNAFALVTRSLELPEGGVKSSIVNYDGFGLRVTMDYDITHKKDVVSIDMLCGTAILDPRLACRLIG